MKLRCIGGLKDGQWEEISDDYRFGDQVSFHLPMKFEITDIPDPTLPECIAANITFYIVDKIGWHDKEPYHKMFLRFVEWSTWQCIEHQFDKQQDEREKKVLEAVKRFIYHGRNQDIADLVQAGHYLLEE